VFSKENRFCSGGQDVAIPHALATERCIESHRQSSAHRTHRQISLRRTAAAEPHSFNSRESRGFINMAFVVQALGTLPYSNQWNRQASKALPLTGSTPKRLRASRKPLRSWCTQRIHSATACLATESKSNAPIKELVDAPSVRQTPSDDGEECTRMFSNVELNDDGRYTRVNASEIGCTSLVAVSSILVLSGVYERPNVPAH